MKNFIFLALLFFTGCGGNNDYQTQPPSPPPVLGDCAMSANALLASYGNPLIKVESADFDGTNDYMSRASGFTGAANGKTGILSFWYRVDGGDLTNRYIFLGGNGTQSVTVFHGADDTLNIFGYNSTPTVILKINTPLTFAVSGTWIHFLASWDLANSIAQIYINDVSSESTTTLTNDTINYVTAASTIGAFAGGTNKVNGCFAEFYFAPNQFLDFSNVYNRRKFISGGIKPVFLGTDGSVPTGTAPIVYLHLDPAEAPADFATNRGTGGNFSITGALTAGSTSPSD